MMKGKKCVHLDLDCELCKLLVFAAPSMHWLPAQIPTVVPEAKAALAAGCAVVIGIQTTGEVTSSCCCSMPALLLSNRVEAGRHALRQFSNPDDGLIPLSGLLVDALGLEPGGHPADDLKPLVGLLVTGGCGRAGPGAGAGVRQRVAHARDAGALHTDALPRAARDRQERGCARAHASHRVPALPHFFVQGCGFAAVAH